MMLAPSPRTGKYHSALDFSFIQVEWEYGAERWSTSEFHQHCKRWTETGSFLPQWFLETGKCMTQASQSGACLLIDSWVSKQNMFRVSSDPMEPGQIWCWINLEQVKHWLLWEYYYPDVVMVDRFWALVWVVSKTFLGCVFEENRWGKTEWWFLKNCE